MRLCGIGNNSITVVRSETDAEAQGATGAITSAAMGALSAIRPAGVGGEVRVFGLSESQISRRVKVIAKAAGLTDWEFFSGHSGRVGMARRMAQNGAPTHEIERQGRWKQGGGMVGRYPRRIRRVGAAVPVVQNNNLRPTEDSVPGRWCSSRECGVTSFNIDKPRTDLISSRSYVGENFLNKFIAIQEIRRCCPPINVVANYCGPHSGRSSTSLLVGIPPFIESILPHTASGECDEPIRNVVFQFVIYVLLLLLGDARHFPS